MGLIEGVPVTLITAFISILGLPGAVLILWYVDNRRYDRQEKKRDREVAALLAAHKEESARLLDSQRSETAKLLTAYKDDLAAVLTAYKDDIRQVTRFYEDNVLLVKNYQRLADDLSGVITLNTQVQTQLVESIRHNMFCPVVREKGPQAA